MTREKRVENVMREVGRGGGVKEKVEGTGREGDDDWETRG